MQKNIIKRLKRADVSVITAASMIIMPVLSVPASAVSYTVTFNIDAFYDDYSEMPSPVTAEAGTTITAPTFDSVGLIVEGWYKEASFTNIWDFSSDTVTGDITLYAKQQDNSSSDQDAYVVFYGNGGTPARAWRRITADSYIENSDKPDVSRTGYTLDSWRKDSPTSTAWNFSTDIAEHNLGHSLYAHWTPDTYTIKFNANGGSGTAMADQTFTYGAAQDLTTNTFTRTGHTFAGWNTAADGSGIPYTNGQNTTFDADTILYAQWTLNTYTITWENYDGTTLETDAAVAYGTTPTYDGTTPAKPATAAETYTFDDWTPAVAAATADAVYTATFTATPIPYTISFDANGGTGAPADITQAAGSAVTAPTTTPTRDGYTFDGWTPTVPATMPTSNTTCVAQWTELSSPRPAVYTLTFDPNGGSVSFTTISQEAGTAVTSPTATRDGYTFSGWTSEVPTVMPASNNTYVAQWTARIPSTPREEDPPVTTSGGGGDRNPEIVDDGDSERGGRNPETGDDDGRGGRNPESGEDDERGGRNPETGNDDGRGGRNPESGNDDTTRTPGSGTPGGGTTGNGTPGDGTPGGGTTGDGTPGGGTPGEGNPGTGVTSCTALAAGSLAAVLLFKKQRKLK